VYVFANKVYVFAMKVYVFANKVYAFANNCVDSRQNQFCMDHNATTVCTSLLMYEDGVCICNEGVCICIEGVCFSKEGVCICKDGVCLATQTKNYVSLSLYHNDGIHTVKSCVRGYPQRPT